jgi:hypothetical protein
MIDVPAYFHAIKAFRCNHFFVTDINAVFEEIIGDIINSQNSNTKSN